MSTSGTVHFHRVLRAPPGRIYRAFLDPAAMMKWLPPHGYTGAVHHQDATEGGAYRMSFTSLATGQSHFWDGAYVTLRPDEALEYTATFENPAMPGTMRTKVALRPVSCGTELTITQDGIPSFIPVENCMLGWQQSLALLALLVEAETP